MADFACRAAESVDRMAVNTQLAQLQLKMQGVYQNVRTPESHSARCKCPITEDTIGGYAPAADQAQEPLSAAAVLVRSLRCTALQASSLR
jgi:hypothetical protein